MGWFSDALNKADTLAGGYILGGPTPSEVQLGDAAGVVLDAYKTAQGVALATLTAPLNVVGGLVVAPVSSGYTLKDIPLAVRNTYRLGSGDDFGGGPAPFTIGDAFHTVLAGPVPNYFYTVPSREEQWAPGTQGGSSPFAEDVKEAGGGLLVGAALLAALALGGGG